MRNVNGVRFLRRLNSNIFFVCCLLTCSIGSLPTYGQNTLEDLSDDVDSLKNTDPGAIRKFYVLPIISASPETSLRLGVVGIFLFRKPEQAPETQLSSIRVPISYTVNQQIKVQADFSYYSNANKHILNASTEWFNFPLLFYGIGNETQESDEEIYTTQTFGVDLDYLRRVADNFYVAFGYKMTQSNIIDVEEGGMLAQPGLIPGNTGGLTSGIGTGIRFDTRDNNLCPAMGFLIDARVNTYQQWTGSEFKFTQLKIDLRKYFQPFKRHVLAVQVLLEDTWGDPSFETMTLLGGKMMMRGHYEGRFRDLTYYAAQAEYRLPIGRKNWIDTREKIPFKERWGLVGFFGVGDVAHSFQNIDLDDIKTSGGFGIRYLVLPKERINVRIDVGFGTRLPAIYFNIREAF